MNIDISNVAYYLPIGILNQSEIPNAKPKPKLLPDYFQHSIEDRSVSRTGGLAQSYLLGPITVCLDLGCTLTKTELYNGFIPNIN